MVPHTPQTLGAPRVNRIAPRSPLDRVALAIATVGGVGWAPVAPGTVASALTLVVLWLVPFSRLALVAFFVAVTLIGTWAADQAERTLGRKDPGVIVIDEVAGMTLSVLVLPLTVPVLAIAFVLFRVFDVVKPAPARQAQALPGGIGVMVDDLVAGLYALVIVAALRALLGIP
jgi:phosphatidylglycerophosphatase A